MCIVLPEMKGELKMKEELEGITTKEELRVIEYFGGIGAIRKALERLEIPFKIVDYVEIDEAAVKSYNAMYGTTRYKNLE